MQRRDQAQRAGTSPRRDNTQPLVLGHDLEEGDEYDSALVDVDGERYGRTTARGATVIPGEPRARKSSTPPPTPTARPPRRHAAPAVRDNARISFEVLAIAPPVVAPYQDDDLERLVGGGIVGRLKRLLPF